jgi:hypothetical protein
MVQDLTTEFDNKTARIKFSTKLASPNGEKRVSVVAEWDTGLSAYVLVARVDGAVTHSFHSCNPWESARAILAEIIMTA